MSSLAYSALLVLSTVVAADSPPYNLNSGIAESGAVLIKDVVTASNDYSPTVPQSVTPYIAVRPVMFRTRLHVPRLAKSYNDDYDPFFSKNNFLPFETRRKPVKVVTFKRKKLQPRMLVQDIELVNGVAEQQSPYNELAEMMLETD